MTRTIVKFAAMALAVASAGSASAQVRLIFASQSPAGTPNTVFFNSWAQKINEAGKGAVRVEVRDGETLSNFMTSYDRVADDVVQIGWIIHTLVGNRFQLTDVNSLPFIGDNNEACSVASWRLYKSGLLDAEYKDIQPIWFGCLTTNYLHWSKEPKQVDDLGGLKFRVSGKVPAQAVQILGGTPISMQAGEMYEGLQRGTIDGLATTWASFEPYKLNEVTTTHLEVPLGGIPSMHFMSKKKFESLPKNVQEVITANIGEEASRTAGAFFAGAAARARAPIAASDKHKIIKLTPQQYDSWKKKVSAVTDTWIKDRANGQQVYDTYIKLYNEAAAGK
jgi:TRAP-type C4-dicarboxylate transport system substrate-binding protein